jgi:uncharacterized protein (DUF433 family)
MTAAYAMADLLGLGLYTVSEAARYARISPAKLVHWVIGTSNRKPAVKSRLELAKNPERWVTFLDFIQAMAIRDIRIARPHISLDKIRETIEMSKSRFGIEYPFARKHTTYLLGDDIRLDVKGVGLVESSGTHKSQLDIREVVEQYLEDLSYDADGLASGYVPFRWKEHDIVFDPKRHFGLPFVRPGRYSVASLCDAFESEGGYRAAAKAYNIKVDAIEAARKYFFDYLRTSDAT